MSKIHDFLNEAGVFFLATVDGDQPKLRPLGFHMEMEGRRCLVSAISRMSISR